MPPGLTASVKDLVEIPVYGDSVHTIKQARHRIRRLKGNDVGTFQKEVGHLFEPETLKKLDNILK